MELLVGSFFSKLPDYYNGFFEERPGLNYQRYAALNSPVLEIWSFFQYCSVVIQRTLKIPALINVVSELTFLALKIEFSELILTEIALIFTRVGDENT